MGGCATTAFLDPPGILKVVFGHDVRLQNFTTKRRRRSKSEWSAISPQSPIWFPTSTLRPQASPLTSTPSRVALSLCCYNESLPDALRAGKLLQIAGTFGTAGVTQAV